MAPISHRFYRLWACVMLCVALAGCTCSQKVSPYGSLNPAPLPPAYLENPPPPPTPNPTTSAPNTSSCKGDTCPNGSLCSDSSGVALCHCAPDTTKDPDACVQIIERFSGLRWELPCRQTISTNVCRCPEQHERTIRFPGSTSQTYQVTFRFRGVVEEKTYKGGSNDGAFWQEGGIPEPDDPWNAYKLTISHPPQSYYLNRGQSGQYHCVSFDYTKKLKIQGGASITISGESFDAAEIINVNQQGKPLRVSGIPPYPSAYKGQFIQMDIMKVEAGP